jgi:hypothetical protein
MRNGMLVNMSSSTPIILSPILAKDLLERASKLGVFRLMYQRLRCERLFGQPKARLKETDTLVREIQELILGLTHREVLAKWYVVIHRLELN